MRKFAVIYGIVIGMAVLAFAVAFRASRAPRKQESARTAKTEKMILTSPIFKDGEKIPPKFTCDAGNINPELQIQNAPKGAKSFVIIMDDPDAPNGTFVHWLAWNIDPSISVIKEESRVPGSVEGKNSAGKTGYTGPCPPPGKPHRYFFHLYALDRKLDLSADAGVSDLKHEIEEHTLNEAVLMGIYGR